MSVVYKNVVFTSNQLITTDRTNHRLVTGHALPDRKLSRAAHLITWLNITSNCKLCPVWRDAQVLYIVWVCTVSSWLAGGGVESGTRLLHYLHYPCWLFTDTVTRHFPLVMATPFRHQQHDKGYSYLVVLWTTLTMYPEFQTNLLHCKNWLKIKKMNSSEVKCFLGKYH